MSARIPNVPKKFDSAVLDLAPADAFYVLTQADESLNNANVLTAGTNVTLSVAGGHATIASSTPVPYVYVAAGGTDVEIQAAINSLGSTGGTVWLAPGTFSLAARLRMQFTNCTLKGSGMYATSLEYTADANTDILTIEASNCTVCDLRISGATFANYVNGGGSVGTGRGIVVDSTTTCVGPYIRNVEVANTGSWCIWSRELFEMTDLGTGVLPLRNYGFPKVATTHGTGTVDFTLDNVFMSYPNSGGCLFLGYGCAAPRIHGIKTISYSFGTYQRIDSAGGTTENLGAVHLFGVSDAVFDQKCVFQSPNAQSGVPTTVHADTDATMLSFLNTAPVLLDGPYFEVLSPTCAGGPGRTSWIVTAINSSELNFLSAYVKSTVLESTTGSPLRVMHTPADPTTSSVGTIWTDGHFSHGRPTYDVATLVPPFESGDPTTQDTDDFVFGGVSDGNKEAVIRLDNCIVSNSVSGKIREVSTSGASILAKRNASFNNRYIKLGKFDDVDVSGDITTGKGPGGTEDMRARWQVWHGNSIRGGIMGYAGGGGGIYVYTTKHASTTLDSVNANAFTNVLVGMAVSGTGIPANTYVTVHNTNSQVTINNAATDPAGTQSVLTFMANGAPHREGLWCSSARDNDFRQVPFMRVHASAPSGLLAGDLWMKLSGTIASSIYPTAQFAWYDGTQWQYSHIGLAAGEMGYWTAAGVPAQLTIGTANYVMASTGSAPNWVLDSQRDVVDGSGNVVTSGGFVVVA